MSYTSPQRPLKLSEMARALGVTVTWLRAEAEAGRIPCLRTDKGMLFDAETVEARIRQRLREIAGAPHNGMEGRS